MPLLPRTEVLPPLCPAVAPLLDRAQWLLGVYNFFGCCGGHLGIHAPPSLLGFGSLSGDLNLPLSDIIAALNQSALAVQQSSTMGRNFAPRFPFHTYLLNRLGKGWPFWSMILRFYILYLFMWWNQPRLPPSFNMVMSSKLETAWD